MDARRIDAGPGQEGGVRAVNRPEWTVDLHGAAGAARTQARFDQRGGRRARRARRPAALIELTAAERRLYDLDAATVRLAGRARRRESSLAVDAVRGGARRGDARISKAFGQCTA